ncbi:Yqey-like protein-domain-containing protein [Hypoxylon argillaceum]|nr:Yqey-like protein-domain-containing protein [Hypoxylon argillaceum]KAI1155183.1 Yqey-like protein-domain-containing protein [Nemania diffusa]
MSLRPSTRIVANLLRPRVSGPSPRTSVLALARSYSDEPTPPLLQKLKDDLKVAMRAKDAARLSVLRATLSATLNASKTITPIKTDVALVALLRRQVRSCTEARDEFAAAGREDLVAKEAAQIAVLEEYVSGSGIEEVSGSKLEDIVQSAVAEFTDGPKMGDVLKALESPGGALYGKYASRQELVQVVKKATKAARRQGREPEDESS